MPVGIVNALNNVQRIPEVPINLRSVTQPTDFYTCPAGKKAIFKGYVVCTGRGAAATASLRDPTDSFNVAKWTSSTTIQNSSWDVLRVGTPVFVTLELNAGEVIKTTQDSGTNAEFDVVGKILELPA